MSGEQVPTLALAVLIARVDAIEARQREYGMHDPDCPRRSADRANEQGGAYFTASCTCWLSTVTEQS